MKLLFTLSVVLLGSFTISFAQMKEGKIVFERVINMRRNITDPEMRARIPESRTDKFQLLFNEQSSLFKSIIDSFNKSGWWCLKSTDEMVPKAPSFATCPASLLADTPIPIPP